MKRIEDVAGLAEDEIPPPRIELGVFGFRIGANEAALFVTDRIDAD